MCAHVCWNRFLWARSAFQDRAILSELESCQSCRFVFCLLTVYPIRKSSWISSSLPPLAKPCELRAAHANSSWNGGSEGTLVAYPMHSLLCTEKKAQRPKNSTFSSDLSGRFWKWCLGSSDAFPGPAQQPPRPTWQKESVLQVTSSFALLLCLQLT